MIPFLDLHKINRGYQEQLTEGFQQFLDSGYYVLGNQVKAFEAAFARYCGSQFCIGTGNGLEALTLILRGYIELGKLQEGDKVLVAANTYIATILSIIHAGLEPVLVEPDEATFTISPEAIKNAIAPAVKAIVPTHLYGQLAAMKSINAIAKAHKLLVISDAAQGHGARDTDGNVAGNLCDATAFSFYPTKNLGALGDAGAITTNDKLLAEVVKKTRNYGTSSKYINEYIGWNSRLDELQATFLSIKLPFLDRENERRRQIAARYLAEIKNSNIGLPYWNGTEDHVFHVFIIRVLDRAAFCDYMTSNGIGYLIHYPVPPHQQKALKNFNTLQFPITEKIHEEVISIPLHPKLTDAEVSEIITVLNRY